MLVISTYNVFIDELFKVNFKKFARSLFKFTYCKLPLYLYYLIWSPCCANNIT